MAEGEPGKGIFGGISGANAVVALIAAIVGIWGAVTTIQLNKLTSEVAGVHEERDWAGKIFDKFYAVVDDDKKSYERRLAAMSGLLTMTELIDPKQVAAKTAITKMIRDQTARYQAELDAASQTQTGTEKQTTEALAATAAAISDNASAKARELIQPTATGSAVWSNYDFDIFWCEASPGAEQVAQAIAGLKSLDPNASGRWRLRPFSKERNAAPGYRLNGYAVRVSTADEKRLAETLTAAIKGRGLLGADSGKVGIYQGSATPYYISVFVCPNAL